MIIFLFFSVITSLTIYQDSNTITATDNQQKQFVEKLTKLLEEFKSQISSNDKNNSGNLKENNNQNFFLFYSFGKDDKNNSADEQTKNQVQSKVNKNQQLETQLPQQNSEMLSKNQYKVIQPSFLNTSSNLLKTNFDFSNLDNLIQQNQNLIQNLTAPKQTITKINVDQMNRQMSLKTFSDFNKYRRQNGLPEILWDENVYQLCKQHTDYQMNKNQLSHDNFDDRLGNFRAANENVAMFTSWQKTNQDKVADRFLKQWIRSPGHQKNLVANNVDRGAVYVCWESDSVYNNKYYATMINVKNLDYQLE